MNVLLILGAVALVAFGFSRWLAGMGSAQKAWVLRWVILVAIVLFIGFVIVRGGSSLAWPLLTLLVPFVLRWQQLLRSPAMGYRRDQGSAPGSCSTVETRWLRMSLNHDTGVMDGEILSGRFRNRMLGSLTQAQLYAFWQECHGDAQSVAILEAFLDRAYSDWRSWGEEGATDSDDVTLSLEDAYAILGLRAGATVDEIKKAHKKLMQRVHPDQGGSTYLAARVNQAKEVLLRSGVGRF